LCLYEIGRNGHDVDYIDNPLKELRKWWSESPVNAKKSHTAAPDTLHHVIVRGIEKLNTDMNSSIACGKLPLMQEPRFMPGL
jgi:hypothetical protein